MLPYFNDSLKEDIPGNATYEMLNSIYVYNVQEYSYVSSKRISYFYSSKPQPHQFTILVSGIPVPSGSRVGESVESFFTEYHPSTYLSHTVVRRTSRLQRIIVSTWEFCLLVASSHSWCLLFFVSVFIY